MRVDAGHRETEERFSNERRKPAGVRRQSEFASTETKVLPHLRVGHQNFDIMVYMGHENTKDVHIRRVPIPLWIEMRKLCLDRGISAREFVIEAIRKALKESRKSGDAP